MKNKIEVIVLFFIVGLSFSCGYWLRGKHDTPVTFVKYPKNIVDTVSKKQVSVGWCEMDGNKWMDGLYVRKIKDITSRQCEIQLCMVDGEIIDSKNESKYPIMGFRYYDDLCLSSQFKSRALCGNKKLHIHIIVEGWTNGFKQKDLQQFALCD